MQKELIVSAPTVDRAIEKALEQLALDRDSVSVEVIDIGRKGFLGIGASDAKIKVTYEGPDEAPAAAPVRELHVREEGPRLVKPAAKAEQPPKPAPKPAPAKPAAEEKPRLVKSADKNAPAAPAEKPAAPRAERPARPALSDAPRAERTERPRREPRPMQEEAEHAPLPKVNPLPAEQWTEPAKNAVAFIDGLLEKMGVEGHAFVADTTEADHVRIEIEGPDMGPVIGRRGDTLDAIQYLASLVLNQSTEDHVRVTIDTEHYRVKRAESLERLARKMAGKVSRYHKAMTLEPMNPYERRIIHSALQDYRGVTTHSTGTEPNRRVVISPEGGKKYPSRGGKR